MFMAAEAEGIVTEDEAVANCVLLLFAGHETTANLIANGLVLLFGNPDQLALLRADPDLTPLVVEEMLRCDGPAGVVGRVACEAVELVGQTVPAGKHVYLALMAANRDPDVFPDPAGCQRSGGWLAWASTSRWCRRARSRSATPCRCGNASRPGWRAVRVQGR
jgi:cytochrome P450